MLAALERLQHALLLSQQAELVRLDASKRAVVRVATTWMAMLQSRLPCWRRRCHDPGEPPPGLFLEEANPATIGRPARPHVLPAPCRVQQPNSLPLKNQACGMELDPACLFPNL